MSGTVKAGSSKEFKTGSWRTLEPKYDKEKCTNCMFCVVFCPEDCIKAKDGKRLETDYDYCKGCGICAVECPIKCIRMEEKE
jgi:2-oxoacid:acceptor oxidoreductase delta subunit (pyruvate/2-ketoisovalerate family)